MIKLDHFVVHVDNDMNALNDLKDRIVPLGFPFEPKWGKGTKESKQPTSGSESNILR